MVPTYRRGPGQWMAAHSRSDRQSKRFIDPHPKDLRAARRRQPSGWPMGRPSAGPLTAIAPALGNAGAVPGRVETGMVGIASVHGLFN